MCAQRKRKRRKPKPYTSREDRFIEEHYLDWSNRQIASALDRSESGVRHRVKVLGLSRATTARPVEEARAPDVIPASDEEVPASSDRLQRLKALRDMMEGDIRSYSVPAQQQPSYFREYRALLKEIDELEGGSDGKRDSSPKKTAFSDAIDRLAEQQRKLLEQAGET